MVDKKLVEYLYRMAHNLKEEVELDRRGKHFWLGRILLRALCRDIYKNSPADFHNDRSGKFIAEKLFSQVTIEFDKNPSKFLHMPTGEKNIRAAIRSALVSEMIPRKLPSTF